MFLDNLTGHTTEEFRDKLAQCNCTVHLLKSNCTDEIQVIDAGIGKATKDKMSALCANWLEDDTNMEKWQTGKISPSERRVLLTNWLAEAWENVCSSFDFEKLGHRTGCLMTNDSSEDDQIRPQGFARDVVYSFCDKDAGSAPI